MSHKLLPVVVVHLDRPLKEYSLKELDTPELFMNKIENLGKLDPLTMAGIAPDDNTAMVLYGDVDLRNVPKNTDCDFFNHIIVYGNFRCSKHKKIAPQMVLGTFDCSNNKLYQGQDIEFPRYAAIIDCTNCLKDFDVLLNKIPEGLKKLVVNIAIDFDKNFDNLKSFLLFRYLYPDLIICDKAGKSYDDKLKKLVNEKTKSKEILHIEKKKSIKQENISDQNFDKNIDISKKDIIKYLAGMQEFNNVSNIEKYVAEILASKDNEIKTYSKKRNGIDTLCIKQDDKCKVANELKLLLEKENTKITQEPVLVKNIEKKTNNNSSLKKQHNEFRGENIKKYISPKMYSAIKKYARNDRIIPILEEINAINKNPLKMKKNDSIVIIVDGKEVIAKNVEREKTNVLAQSFDGNKSEDIKRIIWVVYKNYKNKTVIKCYDYDLRHDTKYKNKLDSAKEFGNKNTFTEQDEKDCIEIGELLQSLRDFDKTKLNMENNIQKGI